MIYYGCPKCQAPMGSANARAGDSETCPQCGNVVLVPRFAEVPGRAERASDHITADSGSSGPNQYDPEHTGTVVAVEMTSKKLKLHVALSLLAVLITCFGAYFTRGEFENQWKWLLAALAATCWYLRTKLIIWWRHG